MLEPSSPSSPIRAAMAPCLGRGSHLSKTGDGPRAIGCPRVASLTAISRTIVSFRMEPRPFPEGLLWDRNNDRKGWGGMQKPQRPIGRKLKCFSDDTLEMGAGEAGFCVKLAIIARKGSQYSSVHVYTYGVAAYMYAL